MILREFIESLTPHYPKAAHLIASSTSEYETDPEKWKVLLTKPVYEALPNFFGILIFKSWLEGLDAELDPAADTDETVRNNYQKSVEDNHLGLQELEVALREIGIEAILDQPFGLSEYCVANGIAKKGENGNLIFADE